MGYGSGVAHSIEKWYGEILKTNALRLLALRAGGQFVSIGGSFRVRVFNPGIPACFSPGLNPGIHFSIPGY